MNDTGIRRPIVREQSINRPESVIQLARKFAEASAAQDKRIYISNQKLLASGQNLVPTTTTTTDSSLVTNNSTQKGYQNFEELLSTYLIFSPIFAVNFQPGYSSNNHQL
ncbi:unnamed protein product [Brugia pahangi]|uniref:Uncharacterized protein n=1 Tax=Brugia pahangi TaxID=6280 RepID=A0A0N4TL72_BRUPA|nr:unnamed protein product [Brugia pahangi]